MKTHLSFFVLLSLTSFNGSTNELITSLKKCQKIDNALERLVCFDEVSKHLPTAKTNKKEPKVAKEKPAKPPKVASVAKEKTGQEFGLEHKPDISELPQTLKASIASIQRGPYKKYTVKLDNGQVWKQTDSENIRLKVGERVMLKRGVLNSFFLGKEGSNKRIRVKRVK